VAPKPAPDGILQAARRLGVPVAELLVVGDYVLDLQAARAAGAIGVHLRNHGPERPHWKPHFQIPDLSCLPDLVNLGLPLPNGKLPATYLERFFGTITGNADPNLVVPPGIGQDVAVVRLATPPSAGPPFLALTADPITFATEAVEDYLLAVNANDLATAGARPRWFLATVLLPPGTTPSAALHLLHGVRRACRKAGAVLVGGHTEVTDAVTRPVIAGSLVGIAATPIRKNAMQPGDRILLTKSLAMEGTALLARELGDHLRELGVNAANVEAARGLLAHISVTREAELVMATGGVSAMHDVTEGGVAEALIELSRAGGHVLRVNLDQIPIHGLTAHVCRVLGANPLGLLGSGSLLLTVRPAATAQVEAALTHENISVTAIGWVDEAAAARSSGRSTYRSPMASGSGPPHDYYLWSTATPKTARSFRRTYPRWVTRKCGMAGVASVMSERTGFSQGTPAWTRASLRRRMPSATSRMDPSDTKPQMGLCSSATTSPPRA